jgi:hypothetical protein
MSLCGSHCASLSDRSDTNWLWLCAAHILKSFAVTFCSGLVYEYQIFHSNSDGNFLGISATVTAFVRIWYIFFSPCASQKFDLYSPVLKLTCKIN